MDLDEAERLSADDMAARVADQFVAGSLALHRRDAQRCAATRGVCANCGARCLPSAVYCDEDCRADHEDRVRRLRRVGGAAA